MNQDDFNEAERRSKLRMQVIYEGAKKPKREWIGLTPDEQARIYIDWDEDKGWGPFYEAIEQALKEKNT